MESSSNQFQEPFHNRGRVDHGIAATQVIAEYFAWEQDTDEESKLREGLAYGVSHGILTVDESDQCLSAYLITRNGEQPPFEGCPTPASPDLTT